MPETIPNNSTPETDAGATPEKKQDLLKTPAVEAAEMDMIIQQGANAHNLAALLTFVGIFVLLAGLYYYRMDKWPGGRRYQDVLKVQLQTQTEKDKAAYLTNESVPYIATWPLDFYDKVRDDMFMIAALTLILCGIFVFIEKAKLRRADLLVYRAMAREIEKMRLRIKELEGGKSGEATDETPAPPGANA